jgi:hypothetical protein
MSALLRVRILCSMFCFRVCILCSIFAPFSLGLLSSSSRRTVCVLYVMFALFSLEVLAVLGIRSFAERCLSEGTKILAPDITEDLLLSVLKPKLFTNKNSVEFNRNPCPVGFCAKLQPYIIKPIFANRFLFLISHCRLMCYTFYNSGSWKSGM